MNKEPPLPILNGLTLKSKAVFAESTRSTCVLNFNRVASGYGVILKKKMVRTFETHTCTLPDFSPKGFSVREPSVTTTNQLVCCLVSLLQVAKTK